MGKRGQGEGSIRKREDGRWEATVSLGYKDGKRQRKSFYGRTRKEVQEQLTKALRDLDQGLPVVFERQTVAEFLGRWLEDSVKLSVRPKTFASYTQIVKLYIVPVLGSLQLTQLTPQHIQAFMNRKLADGLSPRTVQYCRTVLRRALEQALKWEMVPRNVATLVDAPHVRRPEMSYLTPDQAKRFLEAIKGHRLEALFCLSLTVGLRQGEALGLHWEDVDLDAAVLTVRVALQRTQRDQATDQTKTDPPDEKQGKTTLTFVQPKTNRSRRTITIPQVAVAALRAQRIRQLEERLQAQEWHEAGLVFTNTIGRPLDAGYVCKQFRKVLAQANLPHLRYHDLRHSAVSLLLAQGVAPRTIMALMGHSDISTTLNIYGHIIQDLEKQAADKMDALFGTTAT